MDTDTNSVLTLLLSEVMTVSVKSVDSGLYRAWGLGFGDNIGKIAYGDGGTPWMALSSLLEAVKAKRWRVDRFSSNRAF